METTFHKKRIDLEDGDSALIIRHDGSTELAIRHDAHLVSNEMSLTEPISLMLIISNILAHPNRDLLDELGRRTHKTFVEGGIIDMPKPKPKETN